MAKRPNAERQSWGQRRYRNGIEKVCFARRPRPSGEDTGAASAAGAIAVSSPSLIPFRCHLFPPSPSGASDVRSLIKFPLELGHHSLLLLGRCASHAACKRCAASPFCICSMTCAWLFFPISSNESAANSASHGPPKSRQVSLFIENLIPCSFQTADTFSFVRSVIRPVYVEVDLF